MCLGCLFAMLAVSFPRIGLLIMWAFTNWVEIAFDDNWVWPLLGLIFLPFATLMYVFVDVAAVGDINLGGWLMIGVGALIDISHWSQLISNRRNGVALYNQYRPAGGDIAP
ncbi:MAG: hypothetical protein AB7N70_15225 [Dehalococcoidia bacterium]